MKLIVVRHGQSVYNAEKRKQGSLDVPLSKLGEQQADKLAEFLKNEKIDEIFSSPMQRALITAEKINKYHNLKINVDKRLTNRIYGIFDGLTQDEIKQRYPDDYNEYIMRKRDDIFVVPGGESFVDVMKRINGFITDNLDPNSKKTCLIFSHSGEIRALVRVILNLSHKELAELIKDDIASAENCSLTIIEYSKTPKLVKFNDTSFLSQK